MTSLLFLAACADTPTDTAPPEPASLVSADAWSVVPIEDDPWAGALEGEPCDATLAVAFELTASGEAIEIRTDECDFVTIAQPALGPASAGETLEVDIFHGALTAEEAGAEATIWLAVGASEYEWIVPIPSEAGTLKTELALDTDLAAGDPVRFHVHNHGDNYYLLIDVAALR